MFYGPRVCETSNFKKHDTFIYLLKLISIFFTPNTPYVSFKHTALNLNFAYYHDNRNGNKVKFNDKIMLHVHTVSNASFSHTVVKLTRCTFLKKEENKFT